MAALVAAFLLQASDRTPWAAALLGDRHADKKGSVIAGAVVALLVGNVLGGVGGVLIAPLLSPNACDLLVAIALFSGGITSFWRQKSRGLRGGQSSAFLASLSGMMLLGFGDRMQFATAAFAARSDTPVLAVVGGTLGALAIVVPAILLGERGLRKLPTAAIRIGAAVLLTGFGAVLGLAALRLI